MAAGAGTGRWEGQRWRNPRRIALLAAVASVLVAVALLAVTWARGFGPAAPTVEGGTGPVLLVVGDSYSEGVDNVVVWPQLFAETHGYRLANASSGGTGYVNPALTGTFVDRIRRVDGGSPSLIIFAGSRNDIWFPPSEVRAAAREAFGVARHRFPGARIIAVGPIWDSSTPTAEVEAINSAVSQAADAERVQFIDALSADWLADPSLIHPDGIHATDAGQQVLSDGLGAAIGNLP